MEPLTADAESWRCPRYSPDVAHSLLRRELTLVGHDQSGSHSLLRGLSSNQCTDGVGNVLEHCMALLERCEHMVHEAHWAEATVTEVCRECYLE